MATYYHETGTLVDEWNADDVLNQRPDLDGDQASEINIGINWDVIDSAAEYLFPEENS